MQREIRFRAWDKILKQMLPNVQNNINDKDWAFGAMLNDERCIVQQGAPVKDIYKIIVFEGDILLDILTKRVHVVKFGYCKKYAFTGFYCETTDGYQASLNNDSGEDYNSMIKVIGNIYEHPHLLNPAGGQPVSTNMQTDPNAKQEQTEPAQEAAEQATETTTANSEAGEATDTEAGGE